MCRTINHGEAIMGSMSSKVQDSAKSVKETAAQAKEDVLDLTEGRGDIPTPMRVVKNLGITSGMAYTAGVASIFLSLAMWFFRRGGKRETAERVAIFVGLWPPTFMALGKALEGYEHPGR
jgi:aspartate/methionine/tyrosine aminotransferase